MLNGAARLLLWLLPALAWAQPQPEAASGFAPRPAVAAERFIAVTANSYATEAAAAMLREGGSAVDAAVAAQLVLGLVEPQSSGLGGGGFLLHWTQRTRRLVAYDGRETAPRRATAERFAGMDFRAAVASGKSIGTPGLPALLATAHARHGRLAWKRLFEPAVALAEDGFVVSPRLAMLLRDDAFLRGDEAARRLYYREDGSAAEAGSRLRNPAFARTLRALADEGVAAFYGGRIAADIVAGARAGGGDLEQADLAGYRVKIRTPVCGRYRDWRICGMPPPSSGGVTTIELLGLLERTPFAAAAPQSPQAVHWFAEAGRLAYADRDRYLGDADFVVVPQAGLLAPAYLDARARRMAADRSLGKAPPGDPAGGVPRDEARAPELPATTHLSIVDAEGNAVAMTTSVEDAFGSRRMAAGFLLNNQLTDFAFQPFDASRPVANRVEPGKRPLSSMAPTMAFDRRGRLVAVVGSAGGSRIINYVAQTLVAVLDWRLPPDAALALPHFGSRNGPTELERGPFAEETSLRLRALGHETTSVDMTSGTQLIVRSGGRWLGAADPRREGAAAGE
jgi:gamma-glutamyltranspeptidase/glutathione hydrolase